MPGQARRHARALQRVEFAREQMIARSAGKHRDTPGAAHVDFWGHTHPVLLLILLLIFALGMLSQRALQRVPDGGLLADLALYGAQLGCMCLGARALNIIAHSNLASASEPTPASTTKMRRRAAFHVRKVGMMRLYQRRIRRRVRLGQSIAPEEPLNDDGDDRDATATLTLDTLPSLVLAKICRQLIETRQYGRLDYTNLYKFSHVNRLCAGAVKDYMKNSANLPEIDGLDLGDSQDQAVEVVFRMHARDYWLHSVRNLGGSVEVDAPPGRSVLVRRSCSDQETLEHAATALRGEFVYLYMAVQYSPDLSKFAIAIANVTLSSHQLELNIDELDDRMAKSIIDFTRNKGLKHVDLTFEQCTLSDAQSFLTELSQLSTQTVFLRDAGTHSPQPPLLGLPIAAWREHLITKRRDGYNVYGDFPNPGPVHRRVNENDISQLTANMSHIGWGFGDDDE